MRKELIGCRTNIFKKGAKGLMGHLIERNILSDCLLHCCESSLDKSTEGIVLVMVSVP